MKDISTLTSQDEVVAFDEASLLSVPAVQNATCFGPGQSVSLPESKSYDPGNSSFSPKIPAPSVTSPSTSTTSVATSLPSARFASSSPADFMSSSSPSTSSTFITSPPSLGTSYTLSPSITPSPSAACTPSPSASASFSTEASPFSPNVVVKCENPGMPTLMSPQSESHSPPLVPPLQSVSVGRPPSPGKTVSGNLLPPCRICFDKASGFHYGLNTCEACKGFFRRSLKRGASYVCTRDGKCDVTGERRNLCGFCRYQKCIALGMSKKAIKTGRYTHAKRTRDTLEIKKLQRADSDEEDFDEITSHVVKAHDDFVISSTKIPEDVIHDRQRRKIEQNMLKEQWFGQMNQVPSDKHQEIFDMTGIDVDNRREMMEFHVKNSERWIQGYISFAKKVPGFRDLTLSDQAKLIKYARIEFWFLGSFPGYSSELGVAVMPNGRCFSREEMYTVWKYDYIDVAFHLSNRLKKLKVTPEEIIIVKSICLTAGDRCFFDEPEKVEKMQWRMVRCLLHLLKKRCSSSAEVGRIFSEVINCLTELRNLNEAEFQTIQNTQLFDLFAKNPLIMEVLPY